MAGMLLPGTGDLTGIGKVAGGTSEEDSLGRLGAVWIIAPAAVAGLPARSVALGAGTRAGPCGVVFRTSVTAPWGAAIKGVGDIAGLPTVLDAGRFADRGGVCTARPFEAVPACAPPTPRKSTFLPSGSIRPARSCMYACGFIRSCVTTGGSVPGFRPAGHTGQHHQANQRNGTEPVCRSDGCR